MPTYLTGLSSIKCISTRVSKSLHTLTMLTSTTQAPKFNAKWKSSTLIITSATIAVKPGLLKTPSILGTEPLKITLTLVNVPSSEKALTTSTSTLSNLRHSIPASNSSSTKTRAVATKMPFVGTILRTLKIENSLVFTKQPLR
jgi:hypothetical protein